MSEIRADGEPISAEDCALWLERKWARHGEDEDRASFEWIRALLAERDALAGELASAKGDRDYWITRFDARSLALGETETELRKARAELSAARAALRCCAGLAHDLNGCAVGGSVDAIVEHLLVTIDEALAGRATPSAEPNMTDLRDTFAAAEQLLCELEWYALRRKDLSEVSGSISNKTWADFMREEIGELRECLATIKSRAALDELHQMDHEDSAGGQQT